MGWFSSKTETYTPQHFGLPPVDVLAADMLRRAGLEEGEVRRVATLHPTDTPPNPDHEMTAGDPPNPWTISSIVAEQILWDTLNTYVVVEQIASRAAAMDTYLSDGLDGLATLIGTRRKGGFEHDVAKGAMRGFLDQTFDGREHPLWGLVQGYVEQYWIPGVGPKPVE